MDIFSHLICLNDNIDLSNIRLLPSGAITYLVPRNWTSESISNIEILIEILSYLETKIDYKPFQLFFRVVSQDLVQKIEVYFNKIGGMAVIFVIVTISAKFYRITGGGRGQSITQLQGGGGGLKRARKGLHNLWTAPKQ